MKRTGSYIFAWLAAASLAVGLAVVAPTDARVMGQLPDFISSRLQHRHITVDQKVPERTLALITFQRSQRSQVESWIAGLDLKNDPSIAWLRVPVLYDPGDGKSRDDAEERLLKNYPAASERARLVPVFADRASFVRSAGLNGIDQVYAVVVNRNGDVLARVEGAYDPAKAQTLRETLKAQDL